MNNFTNKLELLLEKTKNILLQFGTIIFYIVLVLYLQITFIKGLRSPNIYINNLAYLLIDLITLVVFIAIFRKTLIPDWYDFKKNFRKYIKGNYKYWLYGLLIMIISNTIISQYIGMPVNESLNRAMLADMPVYIISVIMIAPITEEALTKIFFRKSINNKYIYMIATGLIFGSLHLLSISSLIEVLYIIPYSALGCAFGYIYYNSNNIYTNIFFHAVHNLIAVILIFGGM